MKKKKSPQNLTTLNLNLRVSNFHLGVINLHLGEIRLHIPNQVYGSDYCREQELRFYSGGMLLELRLTSDQGGFPLMKDAKDFEECRADEDRCFFVGDER